MSQELFIDIRNLTVSFPSPQGRKVVVRGLNLQLQRGQSLALVGESGSGKSTAARLAIRLENPDAGTVTFDGEDITTATGRRLRALRRRFQIVYQSPYASLDPRLDVADLVAEPLNAFALGTRGER
ncbi:MAG: ATP-binding cassette domain-containing protein, partial [Ewingella sp.]|nr:ATP-binding cassette domain-containing protein [Ewingella sp.]